MASSEFRGNILLVSAPGEEEVVPFDADERIRRPYEILHYDSNEIVISVAGARDGDWLYYADCWHPFWSVTVNGKDADLYKADLAYKAVELEDGENIVKFRFHHARLAFFERVLNWNAVVWLFLPFGLIFRKDGTGAYQSA
jgi:hypothetical protein